MVLTSEFNSLKHVNTVLKEFHPVTYHMFEAERLKVKKCYIKTGSVWISAIYGRNIYMKTTPTAEFKVVSAKIIA